MNKLIANINARRPWLLDKQILSYGFTIAQDKKTTTQDTEIAMRLITAYRLATLDNRLLDRGDDAWRQFICDLLWLLMPHDKLSN